MKLSLRLAFPQPKCHVQEEDDEEYQVGETDSWTPTVTTLYLQFSDAPTAIPTATAQRSLGSGYNPYPNTFRPVLHRTSVLSIFASVWFSCCTKNPTMRYSKALLSNEWSFAKL